jgi:hypothetical protein
MGEYALEAYVHSLILHLLRLIVKFRFTQVKAVHINIGIKL